ncbi:hypothetical protein SK803_36750 [Lentzea sp. BCCO 10_0856]|uniref:CHAD domain-containing protein n=1 Tax=Lentzea miocenica TaxID=3095431 RepID=A0ABU4TC76_9PSEU|nr:hypothetical protein [Lentzea sp. BCCO 10_0856]MDX8035779.1 hypothetical protein [Lentzea sp. BCCO 10_0856]
MAFDLMKVLRRLRPPAPVSDHRPIERIAADLRRVRRTLACFEPGTSAVKKIAARQAYDALLVQACAALEVEHRLRLLPEGMDREIERFRVEECLRRLGLSV